MDNKLLKRLRDWPIEADSDYDAVDAYIISALKWCWDGPYIIGNVHRLSLSEDARNFLRILRKKNSKNRYLITEKSLNEMRYSYYSGGLNWTVGHDNRQQIKNLIQLNMVVLKKRAEYIVYENTVSGNDFYFTLNHISDLESHYYVCQGKRFRSKE